MIRRGTEYLAADDRKPIRFLVADAMHLPYPDEIMDAVFTFGVLRHVPDWQAALTEIERVLRRGGTYCFEELYPSLYRNFLTKHILLHPRRNRFQSEDLKQAFQERRLDLGDFLEIKSLGILGVAVKYLPVSR